MEAHRAPLLLLLLLPLVVVCTDRYNKMVGMITKLTSKLKQLKSNDKFRQEVTQELLNKLYNMGMISSAASLLKAEKMSVSAIARYR